MIYTAKFYLYTQKQNLGVFYLKLKENKKINKLWSQIIGTEVFGLAESDS